MVQSSTLSSTQVLFESSHAYQVGRANGTCVVVAGMVSVALMRQ
jgi:hypothetical protein